MKKILIDKHISEFTEIESSKRPGVLATIKGAVTGWKANRNGRTYTRELWQKALDSDYVKEQVALRHFVGEADHPEDRLEPIIKEMSHSMTDFEFHDETSEVWATIDILDTPNGHMLKTLLDYSGSLSFSTRGSGDVMDNGEVDPDTYQLFAIDAVLRPSYPTATVSLTESENLHKSSKQVKNLIEKYSGNKLVEMSPAGNEISNILEFIEGVKWVPADLDDLKYLISAYLDKKDVVEKVNKASSEAEIRALIKPYYYYIMDQLGPDDYEDEYEDDYFESIMFQLNHPKLNENYGDDKDYNNDIEKLYKKWFRQNSDLGIRSFNLLSDFDIECEEKGTGANKYKEYIMVVNAPFVDVQDWKDEIGQYIADNISSLQFIKAYEINDTSSDNDEDIVWIFKQQIGMPDFGKDFE